MALVTTVTAPLAWAEAPAGVEDSNRAKINYMLNCQGCHGPTGTGTKDGTVPNMKNFIGRFLQVSGGRNFLVQVPGSANAALNDDALAEVLNWILNEMSAQELPSNFVPYSAEEVGSLRAAPLTDVSSKRVQLLTLMASGS